MRKFLKTTALILVVIILMLTGACFYLDKPLPQGTETPKADSLARQMLAALNQPAWDTTRWITWTFRGDHHYLWDKERGYVQLKMDDQKVLLNTQHLDQSIAYEKDQELDGEEASDLIDEAWEAFCNDSYWLVAPFKVFDPGTSRKLVHKENRPNQLLITHTSGGVTPGDSYLWQLEENGMPKSFRMWVSVIPIRGLKATWQDWKTCETGIKLPTRHKVFFVGFRMKNVGAYASMAAAELDSDPFVALQHGR
jgi:hypothetical protein